jgi:O-methyltransferase
MSTRPLFSILHPSARPDKWRAVYDDWMSKCVDPSQVEYILCADNRWGFDAADQSLVDGFYGNPNAERFQTVWNTGRRCYVDAANTAAKVATGKILIVIADDQFACERWDRELSNAPNGVSLSVSHRANAGEGFVVEVSTGTPNEHERGIFVMPIVSRARYERLGYLFYPEYESMYADNDLCAHAMQDWCVINARHLMFPHRHPIADPQVQWDDAYNEQNRPESYFLGSRIFSERQARRFEEAAVQSPVTQQDSNEGTQGQSGSLYLDLLRQVLTRSLFIDDPENKIDRELGLTHPIAKGGGPSVNAETMIGDTRLKNIQDLAVRTQVLKIPGDFMECGVWRGGAAIMMSAVARETHADISVWVADSFEGLPAPNADAYPADAGDLHHTMDFLAVSLDEVKRNFSRYGLLDERVNFLRGFFKDSLPGPVEKLSLLRIDADMYEGVTQALEAMYPKVSEGGYVIIDDYFNLAATRQAVDDFFERHSLKIEPTAVDWCAVYWQKLSSVQSIGKAGLKNKAAQGVKVVHLMLPGQTFSQAWVRHLTEIIAGLNQNGYACVPWFGYTSNASITRNGLTQGVLNTKPCDFILWIDDDNLVTHKQALKLLHELESHPEADVVAAWTWIQADEIACDARASCGVFNERGAIQPIASFHIDGEPELYEVEWTGFPAVAMRRETLVKAGVHPFRPMESKDPELGYGFYGEDIAFSLRLRQNGGRIFIDPTVYVPHLKLREAVPVQSAKAVPTVSWTSSMVNSLKAPEGPWVFLSSSPLSVVKGAKDDGGLYSENAPAPYS